MVGTPPIVGSRGMVPAPRGATVPEYPCGASPAGSAYAYESGSTSLHPAAARRLAIGDPPSMQIKPPGMFSRGKLVLERSAPHITPDSLVEELTRAWAPRGFEVYKSALAGVDVVLKQSGWTGIAIKIKQNNGMTELAYNALSPSVLVRLLAMGLIPLLIVNSTSWQPLLRTFEQYVQGSTYFTAGQLAAAPA